MKLKKMEITGFKSFCEKATIEFPPGISAIVGPNGCGKSNIVDALRWAMGEQSVRQLRGKSMEDVIFAGASNKSPLNIAEVSLTLANDNGSAPEELKDFTEIMLTRRLFRSGESAYLINRQPCRLKDIHNIFLGSGMGAKSYAVIQQGNIGAITDAGPEERRFFIEEAAGITRYKERKKETLRKLDATNQNLLRVTDIITEVERQMNGLSRQAQKAERYKKYREEIRCLDLRLSLGQYDELYQEIRKNDSLLGELRDMDLRHASTLKQLDAAIEEIRLKRSRKNEEISARKSEKFEVQREIDRAENELAHLKEEVVRLDAETVSLRGVHEELQEKDRTMMDEIARTREQGVHLGTELEAARVDLSREQQGSQEVRDRLAALNRELNDHKNSLMELAAQEAKCRSICENTSAGKDNLKRRLKRLDEDEILAARNVGEIEKREAGAKEEQYLCRQELEEIRGEISALRENLGRKNQELAAQVKSVQTMEYERNKIRSRYSALKKMAESFEWYRDGVKAVMKRENAEGRVLGLMADILEPEPGYQIAVEAVLGDGLQYVLVKDQDAGRDAIEFLAGQNAGRGGFVPVSSLKGNGATDSGDRLLDHVTVRPGFEAVAETFLGHVMMAETLEAAVERFNRNGGCTTFVTPGGHLVSDRGIMTGGSPEKLSGILGKKQELRDLEQQLAGLDEKLAQAREIQIKIEEEVRAQESELQHQTSEKNRVTYEEMEAQKALYKAGEDLKHARRALELIRMEQDQLMGEAEDADARMEKYNAALEKIGEEVRSAQAHVGELSEKIAAISADIVDSDRRVTDLRVKLTALNAELENSNNSLRRLRDFQADGLQRMEQLVRDIAEKEDKKEKAAAAITGHDTRLEEKYERLKRLDEVLETTEADYQAIDTALQEKDASVSKVQTERESTVQKIRMIEVEQSQRQLKRENIENRVMERYHRPIDAFRPELPDMGGADLSPEQMAETIADLRQKVEKMGPVNLGAIEEYEQLKERFGFLDTQKTDLLKAMEDLHKVIRKINKISQERFLETFELVNRKLGEVFPRLFSGGTAKLELNDPANPLESGVEFMVHPPGKKLTRLTLLSGGEKALSAIAFVFSIFLIKPASFCILDEIDAPLDEANVYRFNELLRLIGEQSQIIMITHKKKSMEFADILFGITMEQKGVSRVVSVNFERNVDA